MLQFCLGRQLFAALPVVTEGIAGPCVSLLLRCSSSFSKYKNNYKNLNCFSVMGFISTWKRNAVHNLKPFQCPFHHRMVGVSERLSSCGCLDRSCSPFACFKAEKYKKSFWVVFIQPHFHNTLSLGRLQCLCMKDWGYGRVTAEPPQSSASPKLLALALSCSNDQALGCSSAPKAKSFYVTFSAANDKELLFVSLDLQVTET